VPSSDSGLVRTMAVDSHKTKPLPPLVVAVRQAQPTPVQMAAWRRLFDTLVADVQKKAPAGGKVNQGNEEEESDDCQ